MTSLRRVRTALLALLVGASLLLVAAVADTIGSPGPRWGTAFGLGVVEALLLVLVTGIGWVVAAYSERNLQGQPRLRRYAWLVLTAVVSLGMVIVSSSLVLLAVGWTVASHAMSTLPAHSGTRQARRAARLVRRRLVVGDALLWAGVLVSGLWLGAWDRAQLGDAVANGPGVAVSAAALLVVAAAVVRSALVPAHRWLPETTEAPSPVSALLHAGFVNGVGVLALLLWPLFQVAEARAALLLVGASSVLLGAAQVRTRADVKGRLAASTTSQMGYLSLQVALGIPAAVVAHVVGHGVWKAHKFLAAGGAVQRVREAHRVSARPIRLRVASSVAVTSLTLVVLAALVPLGSWPRLAAPADLLPVLMTLGVTALAGVTIARSAVPAPARRIALLVVATGAVTYVVALRGLTHLLEPAFPAPAPWGSIAGWAALAAIAALVLVAATWQLVDRAAVSGRLPALVRRVAGQSTQPLRWTERLAPRPSVTLVPRARRTDTAKTRAHLAAATASTATLYPLTSFVASNPLSGVEGLGFTDAHQLASQFSDAAPGPSAQALRKALERGDVCEEDLSAALHACSALAGRVLISGRSVDLRTVGHDLLLHDDPDDADLASVAGTLARLRVPTTRVVRTPLEVVEGELLDARVRALGHHLCARAWGGSGWSGSADPWHELRAHGKQLDRLLHVRGAARALSALPSDPVDAVTSVLDHMGVPEVDRAALVARVLGRDPGWPAFLGWRLRQASLGRAAGVGGGRPDDLRPSLVATRLALEWLATDAPARRALGRELGGDDLVVATHEPLARLLASPGLRRLDVTALDDADLARLARALGPLVGAGLATLRTEVYDAAFRRRLLPDLAATVRRQQRAVAGEGRGRAAAQLVFCIDARSERLRRQMERLGPWETLGAAGFFGLPVRHVDLDGDVTERTPALLRPSVTVHERVDDASSGRAGAVDALRRSVSLVESDATLALGWAEAAGWALAPMVGLATRLPEAAAGIRQAVRARFASRTTGHLDVVDDAGVEVLADAAHGFLTAHGLTDPADLVLLVGHGATVTNNPHVAAYDCGACGGAAGDVSARVMAATLNDERVRDALAGRGLVVPPATRFVAALHDTTTDDVRLLEVVEDTRHGRVLARLIRDLRLAGDAVLGERLPVLPAAHHAAPPRAVARRRAHDWAQPRPEWGLAGAAAIVVGPRSLTHDLDLEGRVFLQSYRPDADDDGSVLASLLEAPVVVAHWITAQYRASTLDPHRFGAGDKTTHNVLGHGADLAAVVTGARGDLRLGLPWQAVSAVAPRPASHGPGDPWQEHPQHVPGRLLVVVSASVARVEAALARSPEASRLVAGGWITLCRVDPQDGAAQRLRPDGTWQPDGEADAAGEELATAA